MSVNSYHNYRFLYLDEGIKARKKVILCKKFPYITWVTN